MTATLSSLLKEHSQRKPDLPPGKVSSHWKLLKSFINTDEENERHVQGIPKVISHGIHHQGKINIKNVQGQTLKFVALNSTLDCYAMLNSEGKVTVATANGKLKRIKSDECYKGMIFSTKSKQCICWGDGDKLKVALYLGLYLFKLTWQVCACQRSTPVFRARAVLNCQVGLVFLFSLYY